MTKKTAFVVCPGRGTYNKGELGYFANHHEKSNLIEEFDKERRSLGQLELNALDGAERYSMSKHTRGDNASSLIYACALADFQSINLAEYDIVAVTGNSMGWYIALACGGALDPMGGFEVINTMGTLMQDSLIGGQLLYPLVDEDWVEIPGKGAELLSLTEDIQNLYVSIFLGGLIVFAGDEAALSKAEQRLEPVQDRFPMRLQNHAGFHSPLQSSISMRGKISLLPELFRQPKVPLVDGRGHVWLPQMTEKHALWDYTLEHQVVETYDFTAAIRTGLREFAPDTLIVLGPGTTLGGAIAQVLIEEKWLGLANKSDFSALQAENPFLLSMGMAQQRSLVI